jgi:hypothetical protein
MAWRPSDTCGSSSNSSYMSAPWFSDNIGYSRGHKDFKAVKELLDSMKNSCEGSHLVRDSDPLAMWSTVEMQILVYPNLLNSWIVDK